MSRKIVSVSSYLSNETIERRIYHLRQTKVMIDSDLAELYQVPTKVLIQSVKRNLKRFPSDFMWQLNKKETRSLRSQIVTSNGRGGRRYKPYVFTEQGVAMLSSVLNSDRAIDANIHIMRTFMKLRQISLAHKDLRIRIDEMEQKYDKQFQVVFKAIKMLLDDKPKGEGGNKRWS